MKDAPLADLRALLIDMDDTLYREHSYVMSGFQAVAAWLAPRFGLAVPMLMQQMTASLACHGRGRIFDDLLLAFEIPAERVSPALLVDIYRCHRPTLSLAPGVAAQLRALAVQYPLAVVTDGDPLRQRLKVAALGLERLVDHVTYCWAEGAPKPDIAGFVSAAHALGISPAHCCIIGDNPQHDGIAAAALGIPYIRVGGVSDPAVPEYAVIEHFPDLAALLPPAGGACRHVAETARGATHHST